MSAASAATLSADNFPLSPRQPDEQLYYFTVVGSSQGSIERRLFSDLKAARAHAIRKASDLLWECPYRVQAQPEWQINISNESGSLLMHIALSEALDRELGMT